MIHVRARRWLARSVVAVAAALSVSVGVSSLPAQALTPPPPVPPNVVVGGARLVAPLAVEAGIACAATVVCAAGVATIAVGAGLYATRDTWIPWVQGLFAEEGTSNQGPARPGTAVILESFVPGTDGVSWSITARNTGQVTAYRYWQVNQICRVGTSYTTTNSFTTGTLNAGQSFTLTGSCGPGSALVALLAEPYGTDPVGWPANFPKWTASGAGVEAAATYRATAQCVKPDGTTQNVTIEYTGTAGGFIMPSCSGRGLGDHMKAFWLDGILPGSTAAKRIWQTTPVAEAPYPQCDPALTAQGCLLEVHVDGSRCLVGDSRCLEWTRNDPSRLECRYGPYTVVISRCYALERAYQPGGAPLTRANTDGNPETWDRLNPDNSTEPGTAPNPGTGTGTGGGPVTVAPVPTPVTDSAAEPSNDSCFPTGTAAFNPVEWVLRPVKCALWWAFVPAGVGESVTDWWDVNKANLGGTPLGQWWSSFGAWGSAFAAAGGGAAGCQGPGLPTGFLGARGVMPAVIHPWDACSGPKAIAAATVNGLLTVSIAFFSGWRIVRIVGKPFGYDLDLMNGRGEGK